MHSLQRVWLEGLTEAIDGAVADQGADAQAWEAVYRCTGRFPIATSPRQTFGEGRVSDTEEGVRQGWKWRGRILSADKAAAYSICCRSCF